MRINHTDFLWRRIASLFLLAFLAACQASATLIETPAVTESPAISLLPPPTQTPQVVYTTTSNPILLTATLPATYTPESPTPPSCPTLTAYERQTLVREMLQTNYGCELPCWWGVVPGQSNWRSVLNQFSCWNIVEGVEPDRSGFLGGISLDFEGDYYINSLFRVEDGTVQAVEVISGWLSDPSDHSENFAADWQHYSLDQVLQRYGKPSQVLFSLGGSELGLLYDLIVLYDQQGIAISYLGLASLDKESTQACPLSGQVWQIYLWLQSPVEKRLLLDRVFGGHPEHLVYFRSLEEATGMSVEAFYETFQDPDSKVCLLEASTLP